MSGLKRRRILACSILLAVLACASLPGPSQASRKIHGPGYSSIVPNGWQIATSRANGWRYLRAFAPRKGKNSTKALLTVGVSVISAKELVRQSKIRALPSSPEGLLALVANSPDSAQGVQIVAPIRPVLLDDKPAAASAAQYVFNQTTVLQSNMAALYRGRVYSLELEVDTGIQYAGIKVFGSMRNHWRWR